MTIFPHTREGFVESRIRDEAGMEVFFALFTYHPFTHVRECSNYVIPCIKGKHVTKYVSYLCHSFIHQSEISFQIPLVEALQLSLIKRSTQEFYRRLFNSDFFCCCR